jgi:hypothetical protein
MSAITEVVSIPTIDTPHRAVIIAAVRGEVGEWCPRGDGMRFWLVPREPYTCVHVYWTGRVTVSGRLADKVTGMGGTPRSHVGYVGLQWKVRP